MKVGVFQSPYRRIVIVLSLSGGFAFLGMLLLWSHLIPRLTLEEAQSRVRQCIQREISEHHMAILKEKGIRVPDTQMAMKWKEQIQRTNKLEFLSVHIRRPIPDILCNPESPSYVVKVVFREETHHQSNPRYFFVSWDGVDREMPKFMWFISL